MSTSFGSSKISGTLLSAPNSNNKGKIIPSIGSQILKLAKESNIQAKARIIAKRNSWLVEFLVSAILVLAISKRPPGNVGIGIKEIQPKKHSIEPAFDRGWDHTSWVVTLSENNGLNKLTINGMSGTYCIDETATISGVKCKPTNHSIIPKPTIVVGTIRALQPNISRSFHGLASILGKDGIIKIPNGQISNDFGIKPILNSEIEGSGIGVR